MFFNNIKIYKKKIKSIRVIVLFLISIVFINCMIYANDYMQEYVKVNKSKLPKLDSMYVVKVKSIKNSDSINKNKLSGNEKFLNEIGISLLNSKLSSNNAYIIEKIRTDNEDYATLTYDNYIIGDTSNYIYNKKDKFYTYDIGNEYYSPISLKVDIILSEEQMKNGWEADYLGNYKFKEQYLSEKGYKVNIIESVSALQDKEKHITEKIAIFVVDGIRYTVRGRTSLENIKYIVDTMSY